ncbi:hypothetical protein HTZ84_21240 [Haloterrigena sp. SYSU A558-1]|uniref:Uncharacterized protein n=1 Tax=Haloterrigena gelatinilytica TaxID=2741724 RepID=A0ABX2LPG6_9EURY|nr:hypothetical protein [Haloterrigena gelatinilytica]
MVDEVEEYVIDTGMTFCAMVTRENESGDNISYKVTFPDDLELAGIVHRDDSVYWWCDMAQGQVLISDTKDPWRDEKWRGDDRFDQVQHTNVTEQRVTTIPKQLFGNYTSPFTDEEMKAADRVDDRRFYLRNRHLYYAVSPWDCLAEHAAFFVPIEEFIDMFDEAAREAGMDGGRDLAERFVDEDDLQEDHETDIDEILTNAKTDPPYWPDPDDDSDPDDDPGELEEDLGGEPA